MWIVDADEQKTNCVTQYRAVKFFIMPYKLTNVLVTFCTLMSQVFHDYLDKFMVVYLDDIVDYSSTLEEHKKHMKMVFKKLRDH